MWSQGAGNEGPQSRKNRPKSLESVGKVRYHPKVVLEVHIDTDEGNACDLESATRMELTK